MMESLVEECMEASRRGLKPTSHKNYRWYLRCFARWIGPDCPPQVLTRARLLAYFDYLCLPKAKGGPGYKGRTVCAKWMGVAFLCKWLVKEKILPRNPMPKVKMPDFGDEGQPVTTLAEAMALLAACESLKTEYRRKLGQLVIMLLYVGQIRRSELLSIRMQDLDMSDPERPILTVYFGKGGKSRKVPLSDECVEALRQYLALRFLDCQHENLLAHPNRQWRLAEYALYSLLKEISGLAGFDLSDERTQKRMKPHAMRRGGASAGARSGIDVATIQKNLGHADIKTTMLYIQSDLDDQIAARNQVTLGKKPEPKVDPEIEQAKRIAEMVAARLGLAAPAGPALAASETPPAAETGSVIDREKLIELLKTMEGL